MNGIEAIEAPVFVSDGTLLSRFLTKRDDAAFAELVARHGPLVFGVCLRRLGQSADAEDAFQAVFLALANQAKELGDRQVLGPWLYTVARRISGKALRSRRRRRWLFWSRPPELQAAVPLEVDVDLDAALSSLSEDERSAIILCHMEGYSRSEAAKALGCPEGTLSARLSRGLEKLRKKLGKPPLAILAAATVVMLPEALPAMTVASVRHLRAGTLDEWASPQAVELYRTEETVNLLHRAGPVVGAVVAVGLVMVGVSFGWNLIQAQEKQPKQFNPVGGNGRIAVPSSLDPLFNPSAPRVTETAESSLLDAVREFNERAKKDPIGKTQPPLTTDEVVAAIRSWPNYTQIEKWPNSAYVQSVKTVLEQIADTELLPRGVSLKSTNKFIASKHFIDLWRIEMVLSEPRREITYIIRDQKIRSHKPKYDEPPKKAERKNMVYRLKNVAAESVVNLLKQTLNDAEVSVATDASTNSIIISASSTEKIESVLKAIQTIEALKE